MRNTAGIRPPNSYDVIADIYDTDMGQNIPFGDIGYYVARARERPQQILELGCGTGRITLPLLEAGLAVTAADVSAPMLSALRQKLAGAPALPETSSLHLVQMEIRQWALDGRFSTILCPYSLFTYLVESSEQREFLQQVRSQLKGDGHFILDLFLPNGTIQYGKPTWDYRRALGNGRLLERWKLIEPGPAPQVNLIRRHYRILTESGDTLRAFSTVDRIRYSYPEQMRALLGKSGFDVVAADWDYGTSPSQATARFVTFRCRAR